MELSPPETTKNYKIYYINSQKNDVYVGLTERGLEQRLQSHISDFKTGKRRSASYKIFENLNLTKTSTKLDFKKKIEILLLEEICNNKKYALEREQFWIKSFGISAVNGKSGKKKISNFINF